MSGHILLVDDDPSQCKQLALGLSRRGFEVTWRTSAAEALEVVATADVDTVVADLSMPGMNGLELCERITTNWPDLPVTMLTACASLDTAIAAIRAGAFDFVIKPPNIERLVLGLERGMRQRLLRREEVKRLRGSASDARGWGELLGASAGMQKLRAALERVADADASVLITGESGTGKELVARALHHRGRRPKGPFVPINCAAVPEALLESELFGHVRGAFTDARAIRPGLFAQANGGTLFLDEIGELPLGLQPKLLRALQEHAVRPVGADSEITCDVRLVAATNQDLEWAVTAGRFRQDLYFRINVIHVSIPPLRVRGNDVLLIAQHFIDRYATQVGKPVVGLSSSAADRLLAYTWPGNVRELQNCIERAVVLAEHEKVAVDDLPERVRCSRRSRVTTGDDEAPTLMPLREVERQHIIHVLDAVSGNKVVAARTLGISRKTLYRKLGQYGGK